MKPDSEHSLPTHATMSRSSLVSFAFLLGALLTVGYYIALEQYLPADSIIVRYSCGHPIEYVTIGLFFWALSMVLIKCWHLYRQRVALSMRWLPPDATLPLSITHANQWLEKLQQLPRRKHKLLIVRRFTSAVEYIASRQSTEGLDEHLRTQAENDAEGVHNSFSLVRFITWAIPILGFLGTVLGITQAIANITPEQLSTSIGSVTDGLAVAFDTTALALGLSIGIMFLTYVVERNEQHLLLEIDTIVEQHLAHRLDRTDPKQHQMITQLEQQHQVMMKSMKQIVTQQIELWQSGMQSMQKQWEKTATAEQERFSKALQVLLDATLDTHHQRLLEMEKQSSTTTNYLLQQFHHLGQGLQQTSAAFAEQQQQMKDTGQFLQQLLSNEQQLLSSQQQLQKQLHSQIDMLQQVLQSLTAAVHILTTRLENGSDPYRQRKEAA